MTAKRTSKHENYRYEQSERIKIPTESDDRYMRDEERAPVAFYPDARSEDAMPRLSWRRSTGREAVARPSHPLYEQEKIDPAWFINHLIDKIDAEQTQLFAFNGFPKDAKYDWYKHKGNWSNRLIHGDSSAVMASLLNREGMKGKVQMIYFDPPYGIKFDSMFQVSTEKKDGGGEPNDSKSRKMFRDTYKDGVHSYLNWIYNVAMYSRNMLKDSGSFFLQINSEHLHRIAVILDEVFGAENRMTTITWLPTNGSSSNLLPEAASYILWYAKDKERIKYNKLYEELESRKDVIKHMSSYAMVELADGSSRPLTKEEREDPDRHLPPDAKLFKRVELSSQGESKTGHSAPFVWDDTKYDCPVGRHWGVSYEGLQRLADTGRLAAVKGGGIGWKQYEDEMPGRRIHNAWCSTMPPPTGARRHFIVETRDLVIERCMLMATDPGDLVLDPTCGSGTTAAVAEGWGRRWITIDVNSVPIALCRQRLITLISDWFLTLDSAEGRREDAKLAGSDAPEESGDAAGRRYDPSSGFVYRRIPYASAATFAYGEDRSPTLLVNQPVKRRGVKRISSPFSVGTLSPHKYVNVEEYGRQNESADNVLEGLGVSGIIIPGTGERWHIEDAVVWEGGLALTHRARVRETGKIVAMTLLPDDMTGGANLVNKAAEEAADYSGIETVLVLAFEFEAEAGGRGTERRGRLEVHKVVIGKDVALGDLKHKPDDASFVMLGEPDIDVLPSEKQWIVRVNGYDMVNPKTVRLTGGGDRCHYLLDAGHKLRRAVVLCQKDTSAGQAGRRAGERSQSRDCQECQPRALGKDAVLRVHAVRRARERPHSGPRRGQGWGDFDHDTRCAARRLSRRADSPDLHFSAFRSVRANPWQGKRQRSGIDRVWIQTRHATPYSSSGILNRVFDKRL